MRKFICDRMPVWLRVRMISRGLRRPVHYNILLALTFLAGSAVPAGAEVTELADFVVRQNQDARSKLTSFQYDYTRDYEQHQAGPRRIRAHFKGEWRQRGLEQWLHQFRHSQYSDDPSDVQDEELFIVVGQRASARYSVGSSNPNQHEHDDIAKPSDAEQGRIRSHVSEDPMFAAFGDGSQLLDSLLNTPSENPVRWEAERVEDGTGNGEFVLRQTLPGQAHPVLVCRLGPASGWLITHAVHYVPDGQMLRDTSVVAEQEPATGLWYPADVRRLHYQPSRDGTTSLHSTTDYKVRSFRANVEFPEQQFTAAALGLPVGTVLISVTVDGAYVMWQQTKDGLRELKPVPSGGRSTPLRLVASSSRRPWFIAAGLAVVALLAVVIAVALHGKRGGRVTSAKAPG